MLNLRSLPKDIQGILPLKPLKENTIQENSILLVKQDKYSLFIITLDLI